MARNILLPIMLVGALLVVPNALALPLADDADTAVITGTGVEPVDALLDTAPADAVAQATDTATDAADGVLGALAAEVDVDDLLCPQAVRVTLVGYGGRVTDRRDRESDFLRTVQVVTAESTKRVPVTETVTEVVLRPTGLLSLGLDLEPVTREVTRVVGFELQTLRTVRDVDTAVHVEWTEEYVEWERVEATALVALPVGLPLVADGRGELVPACDGAPVQDHLPRLQKEGYDYFHTLLHPSDGWYARVTDYDARMATADDYTNLPWSEQGGVRVCPLSILGAVDVRLADLDPTDLELRAQDDARRGEGLAPHEETQDGFAAPASAGMRLHVPAATGTMLASILALAMTVLGFAGRTVLRRRAA